MVKKIASGLCPGNCPIFKKGLISKPPSGCFEVINIYVNAEGKFIYVYDDKTST